MADRQSVIPAWASEIVRGIESSFGPNPALMSGAMAAALVQERERSARAAEQRGKVLGEPAVGSDIATTIRDGLSPTTDLPSR